MRTSGQELLTLRGHLKNVEDVAFSSDGRRLATGSTDGTVKVWDAISGQELLTLRGHPIARRGAAFSNEVNDVAFSPDGQRLATACRDGSVQVYALGISELLDLARKRVTRNLSADECERYFQSRRCPPLP